MIEFFFDWLQSLTYLAFHNIQRWRRNWASRFVAAAPGRGIFIPSIPASMSRATRRCREIRS